MSDLPDAEIRRFLGEVRSGGPGNHAHLDDLLGALAPPLGDSRWVGVARQVAEFATRLSGRFIVAVSLRSGQELPVDFQVAGIADVHEYEPPAVFFVSDHDARRTFTGEYYRLDLAESTADLLIYVNAARSLEERAAAEPFDITLCFEKRT